MLNDLVIRKTAIPPAGAVQVADGRLPGFGLRVYSSGIRSFYLTYRHNGRSRRLCLGRYPFTTLSQARAKAHRKRRTDHTLTAEAALALA